MDFNYGGAPDLQYFAPKKGVVTRVGPVIAAKTYSIKQRGISFNGVDGPLSAATLYTPAARPDLPRPPAGVTLDPLPLGASLTWTYASISDPDYKYTEIFWSGASTAPGSTTPPNLTSSGISATIYLGASQFTIFVWLRNVNRSGQKSAWVAAGSKTTAVLDGGEVTGIPVTSLAGNVFNLGISAMSAGGRGTYAFLKKSSAGIASPGDLVAGADLNYTDTGLGTGASPPGTWRCTGRCPSGQATDWLRVT